MVVSPLDKEINRLFRKMKKGGDRDIGNGVVWRLDNLLDREKRRLIKLLKVKYDTQKQVYEKLGVSKQRYYVLKNRLGIS